MSPLSWGKPAAIVLLALFLVWAGWHVAGWRADAAQLVAAKAVIRAELQRRVASDAERISVERKLRVAEDRLAAKLVPTLKVIHDHAPKSPGCDIPDDIVGRLSNLRNGG